MCRNPLDWRMNIWVWLDADRWLCHSICICRRCGTRNLCIQPTQIFKWERESNKFSILIKTKISTEKKKYNSNSAAVTETALLPFQYFLFLYYECSTHVIKSAANCPTEYIWSSEMQNIYTFYPLLYIIIFSESLIIIHTKTHYTNVLHRIHSKSTSIQYMRQWDIHRLYNVHQLNDMFWIIIII